MPVNIVTTTSSNMASTDPSPWSGEKPKYLSMKFTWPQFLKRRATLTDGPGEGEAGLPQFTRHIAALALAALA